MKKIELMALAVLLGFAVHADTQIVGGITWSYQIIDGGAVVTGSSSAEGAVSIPATLGECPVTAIADYAFSYCESITSMSIPKGVKAIGSSAFIRCSGLAEFLVDPENANFSVRNGLLCDAEGKTVVCCPRSLDSAIVPEGVTRIGDLAFHGCMSLTSLVFSAGVQSVGEKAFCLCSSLETLELPDSVTELGNSAFFNCGVKTIRVSKHLTHISSEAFYLCRNLVSMDIPDGVMSIEASAFAYCSAMESISIPHSVTNIGAYAFGECDALSVVYVDRGDADRVKGMVVASNSGLDLSGIHFAENGQGVFNVVFDLGEYGVRTGGGELKQTVTNGCAAIAPEVGPSDDESAKYGWKVFDGWSSDFSNVTNDLQVTAIYRDEVPAGFELYFTGIVENDKVVLRLEPNTPFLPLHDVVFFGCKSAGDFFTEIFRAKDVGGGYQLVYDNSEGYVAFRAGISLNGGSVYAPTIFEIPQYEHDIAASDWFLPGELVLSVKVGERVRLNYDSSIIEDADEYGVCLDCAVWNGEGEVVLFNRDIPTSGSFIWRAESCGEYLFLIRVDEYEYGYVIVQVEDDVADDVICHTVSFNLGEHGTRTGGGELTQTVTNGCAAVAPTVAPDAGWTFDGWDKGFVFVTNDLTVTARYSRVAVRPIVPDDPSGKDWYVGDTYDYQIDTPVTEGGTQLVLSAWSAWNYTNLNVIASDTNSNVRFYLENEGPYGIDFDWTKNYWLEIVASSNGVITGAESGWFAADSMVVLTPEADADYSFLRWTGDTEGCVETNGVLLARMTQARRIGAEFSQILHTVTFDLGEHGTRTGGGELSQTVAHGGAAVAPVVTPDAGWTFDGWDCEFADVRGDLTVTARYSATSYRIEYVNTQGVTNLNPRTYTVNDEVTFAALPDLPARRFAGWTPAGIVRGTTGDLVVTGNWSRIRVKLFPDDPLAKDWYVGDTYDYQIETPVTEGGTQLVLSAWSAWNYTNLNVIASDTNSNVRFELENAGPYGIDFTWAKNYWLEIVASTNGTITGAESGWFAADSMIVLTPVADAGYSFLRWTGDTEGCVETNGVLLAQMTQARRIGAEFSRVMHTVTFDLGEHGTRTGGGELSQTVAHGGAAVAPTVTPDTGWTFDGWDCEFADVRGDLTVTARYSAVSYHIEYVNTQGVTNLNPRTYTVNDELTFAALPDLPTQRFAGWTPAGIVRGTTGDLVVTGNWSRIKVQPIVNDPTGKDWHVGDTYNYEIQTPVTEGGTQFVLSAWSVWNYTNLNVIASGTNSNVRFELENEGPYGIETVWQTNYWLEVSANGPGHVEGVASGWYAAGSEHSVHAQADEGAKISSYSSTVMVKSMNKQDATLDVTFVVNRPSTFAVGFGLASYVVTFDLGEHGTRTGGGELSQTVAHGGVAVAPTVAADEGWTFDGWDCEFADVRGDLTVTARYSAATYHIEYVNTQGVTNLNPSAYTVNDELTFAALPDLPTQRFAGWTPAGIARGTTGDLVVTGNWSRIKVQPIDNDPSGKDWYVGETYDYQIATPVTEGGTQLVLSAWSAWNYTNLNVIASGTNSNVRFYLENEGPYGIDLDWAKNYWLEIVAPTNGTITGAESGWFAADSTVVLAPVADAGYSFLRWTGDTEGCVETNGVLLAQMTQARQVGAEFSRVMHTVAFDLGEHGTRTGGGELSQTVAHGCSAVAPTVAANDGWTFDGWDCEFADVRSDLTVTARYSAATYHIEYVNTQGVTNLNPSAYTVNDELTFAALPDLPTQRFAGWTPAGIARGTTGDLVVTGNWSRIKVQPIDNDPSGKDWYVGETYDYQIATPVTEGGTQLVLSAWSAWNYTNLNVIASDTNSNVRFYLENEGPYGIDFDWTKNYWLEIVASSNGVITGAESGWYAADSMVVLTPVADAGYSFLRWTGDTEGCVETNGVLLAQMTQARRIGAEFSRVMHTVTFDLGEHGTRTGGGELSQTVAHGGAAVAPTVTPDTGWTFDGWDEDFSVVIADLTVRAQWKLTPVEPGKWNYDYTSAKTFADENDLPLVVFWTNPGCAQCERMTEAFETQKYRNWQASRDYVFVFSEGDASVKEFVKNDSGLYPFVAVQWPSQEIDVRFTARNGLMPVTEGDLVDQFTQSVDLSLFGVVLSVESDYGSPEPSVGDHLYMAGSIVTAAVEIVVKEPDERTQHVCVSGKGTGSVPATISSSGAVFEITEDSTLVWNWYTQNMLTILEPENGTIGGAESGWFLEDMSNTLTATPASGFKFNGWTGDTDGCAIVGNEITVPMSKPRQIGAEFSRITHTVTFDLGEHGMRTGGGELTQTVADGESAIAPAVTADEDWTFDGWDKDFSAVTADLTVTAKWSSAEAPHQKPDWTAPINLENWQVIYAKIYDRSSKTYLAHEESMLGAFDSMGNCIGHATIIPALSLFQVNAGFDGGSISGVRLKYWDPERGEIEIRESLTLESGANIGTIASPRVFDVGFIDMEIPLNENFSWISIPLVLDDPSISSVFADCGLTEGDTVTAPGRSATLYGGKWYSSPESFVVRPGETYVVKKSSSGATKLRVSGSPMNAVASVVLGWNWVGSMSVTNVPVASLAHSGGFADEDAITGQGAGNVSSYLEGIWYGMDTLNSGVGYKIKVTNPGSLSYDSVVSTHMPMMLMAKSTKVFLALGSASDAPNWVSPNNKENWQIIYGRVKTASGAYLGGSGAKLAAFDSEGNCIGVSDFNSELSMFMLNVGFDGGSTSGVALKYWDSIFGVVDIDVKITVKNGENIGTIPSPEVYDCIVEEPIPPLPQNPTADDVKNALDGSADAHLQECITEPTVYNDYRAWAETVKAPGGSTAAGAQAVKDSPNAWLSFALDSATLIQTPPADGDVKVEKFEQTATAGSFDFTVGVENIPVGDDATPSNLAKVFGIEGGSTLSPQDMSFDKVDITFGTPENGKVKFTAGPKDKTQPTFFMKVKIK